MLLELYVADTVDKRLPVSSLGYASGISIPTATRQTIEMDSCKFVVRERDPHDGRRTNIPLTARGRAILTCILDVYAKSRANAWWPFGQASCRECVDRYVSISEEGVSFKNQPSDTKK